MEITQSIAENLVNMFHYCFTKEQSVIYDEEVEALALKVLRFFGIKKKEGNIFCWQGKELTYKGTDYLCTITPLNKILSIDIESLEDILNKNLKAPLLSPLFDCLGWTIGNTTGKYKMEFVGGALYDSWRDVDWDDDLELDDWKEGLDSQDLDWKLGGGWQDGFHLENLPIPFWENVEEKDRIIP